MPSPAVDAPPENSTTNDHVLTFRVPAQLHVRLQQLANRERNPVSCVVRRLISERLSAAGDHPGLPADIEF